MINTVATQAAGRLFPQFYFAPGRRGAIFVPQIFLDCK
jgi:hypothetical protein